MYSVLLIKSDEPGADRLCQAISHIFNTAQTKLKRFSEEVAELRPMEVDRGKDCTARSTADRLLRAQLRFEMFAKSTKAAGAIVRSRHHRHKQPQDKQQC